ncbi:MAG: fimbria major subunit [Bacteroides sp.]|nr:fimbria major subunit [Bacteroides sp.]
MYLTPDEDYTFAVSAGDKKIVAVANMELGNLAGLDLSQVTAYIYDQAIDVPSQVPFTGGIPMSGESAVFSVSAEEIKSVEIIVSRLFSRFNAPTAENVAVEIELPADIDSLETLLGMTIEDPSKIKFELKEYIVVNGLKKLYVLPNYGAAGEDGAWDTSVWTLGNSVLNYTASSYTNGFLGTVYSGDAFLGESDVVYLYENKPVLEEFNSVIGFDHKTVYAFIIKADLSYEDQSVERYWRINVEKKNDADQAYKIRRNAIYKVNVNAVKTIGHGTPEDAEEEKPIIPIGEDGAVEVTIDIADWRVFESGTEI